MPSAAIQGVQPGLRFIPPDYTPWFHRLARLALPLLLRWRGVRAVEVCGSEPLARLFADAQAGRIRLLIAFRHPSTTDPLVMAQLVWKEVPKAARRLKLPLAQPVHGQFLYDRGIPLWAGQTAGWMLSKLGGITIKRGRLDRRALKTARNLCAHGPFPLAIAPEGGTNNHGELLGPLEPGLAQMAFWCCDDLAAAGRDERVVIVPVALQYHLVACDWNRIDQLLGRMEDLLGLPATGAAAEPERRYGRLIHLAEQLLGQLEAFYGQPPVQPTDQPPGQTETPSSAEEPAFQARIVRLRERALAQAEAHFQLRPKGSIVERCHRIEQAGWQAMYRDDLEGSSALELSLADWSAQEAAIQMNHMRLAEQFASISGSYVAEKPSIDRYGELLLILWGAIAWIRSPQAEAPPSLGPRRVTIVVGESIEVGDQFGLYRSDRRTAVDQLTAVIRSRLEAAMLG
ncbi:1-acyl-sn-glycerol-3-phosphate acyltransferase [Synechococcus sp. CS-602]|uniref:1-acyl-sn-glycerol-3-phosphate acyltransferase n=1 Tax=Synechococcaceae TaxID=1890426 RepID=UPI0008FF2F7D|nr:MULTISPECIES: 1-acyl-sn-glycerol-3-phosphate acyltransferase [Synechococcaceae]APD48499.1 glycerol acyltransferase [Synechococcus sp. SynAce01]MCT0205291.1 1-acyl-sn-glycerol-3-phosphate acyltransferase [Synechococcus sp. CS-602]MCT0246785.1 1-acyl-sn-glycerol-3-phosphate acyltransferase [Synechococcus sp. CS-601]MCT4367912.1 1-acyl-sn-glycerol-3-phosphate acyltransferase [Candidatus Regnicoccus frigidus MAG-AL2]TWB95030.1 1-acyl-sn-glycerol-3-phosphate acyltransferase [Synechococcus sp. Ac